jgi:hypothetical protein
LISFKALPSLALLSALYFTVPFCCTTANGQSISAKPASVEADPLERLTPQAQVASENGEAWAGPSPQQAATANPSPAGPALNTADQSSFFRRLFKAYADDWKPTVSGPSAPVPAFRGDPAPVNGPPFPFSVWPIGGTVWIGQPWTQADPLMTALWEGPHGDAWKKSRIQIYGWLNVGANFSTSKRGVNPSAGKYENFPTAYDEVPNADRTRSGSALHRA